MRPKNEIIRLNATRKSQRTAKMALPSPIHHHPSWAPVFDSQKVRLSKIGRVLGTESAAGTVIYPPTDAVFRVFEMDLAAIKVVLIGQDPYINANQAMGLSFSVPVGERIPPSLQNIFKELHLEYPETYTFTHGDLTKWQEREGVFLLNASLTVRSGNSGSHMKLWQKFTDNVIRYLATARPDVVFLLLGNFAKSKCVLLPESQRQNVVYCVHPSPLSAHQGFFNSDVFKKVNKKLAQFGNAPINWQN